MGGEYRIEGLDENYTASHMAKLFVAYCGHEVARAERVNANLSTVSLVGVPRNMDPLPDGRLGSARKVEVWRLDGGQVEFILRWQDHFVADLVRMFLARIAHGERADGRRVRAYSGQTGHEFVMEPGR